MHTGWFPDDVKPARAGVYQRDYGDPHCERIICYCYWDGQSWFAQCETAAHAKAERCPSLVPAPWRGLTLDEFVERHRDATRALLRHNLDSLA